LDPDLPILETAEDSKINLEITGNSKYSTETADNLNVIIACLSIDQLNLMLKYLK